MDKAAFDGVMASETFAQGIPATLAEAVSGPGWRDFYASDLFEDGEDLAPLRKAGLLALGRRMEADGFTQIGAIREFVEPRGEGKLLLIAAAMK